MKVLLLAPYSNPLIQRLHFQLVSKGVQVVIASFNVQDNEGDKVYSLGELKNFSSYLYSSRLKGILEREKPDLVHSHVINHYGILGARIKNIPKVLTLWGSDVLLAPKSGSFLKKTIFKYINKFVYERSDIIHSSSAYVMDELSKQVGGGNKSKECIFYWGQKLVSLTDESRRSIQSSLNHEFNIGNERFVVFPRGVSKIYSPLNVINIVNLWKNIKPNRVILIFKAFTADSDWAEFINKIDNPNVIFINRLLSEKELAYIYSHSDYHFSLPVSDNLGGGVVEPYQLGSFPVLSNIPAYELFCKNVNAITIKSYDEPSVLALIKYLEKNKLVAFHSQEYSDPASKILGIYKRLDNV